MTSSKLPKKKKKKPTVPQLAFSVKWDNNGTYLINRTEFSAQHLEQRLSPRKLLLFLPSAFSVRLLN